MKSGLIVALLCTLIASSCMSLRQASTSSEGTPVSSGEREASAPKSNIMWVMKAPPTFSPIYFDGNDVALSSEAKAEIDRLIAEMKRQPNVQVIIKGHTCDIGTDAENMGLGQRRADAVKAHMIQQGVDAKRLLAMSLGESSPAVPNTDENNRCLNRRVEFEAPFAGECVGVPVQPIKSSTNPPASVEPKRMILTDSKPIFDNIIFEKGKAILGDRGKIELDQLITEMKAKTDVVVVVEGHTCDIGSAQDNLALGQRRADAVKRYLIENGIDAKRIMATSLGENDPAIPNDREVNRKLNRSVTLDANFPFEGALVPAQ